MSAKKRTKVSTEKAVNEATVEVEEDTVEVAEAAPSSAIKRRTKTANGCEVHTFFKE